MAAGPSKAKRSRRRKPSVHGEAVTAPNEDGFVSVDTPDPPRAKRPSRRRPAPVEAPSSGMSAVWAMIKVSFGVLIVVGASLATAWGARQFALTTPRFAIVAFDVEGNRRSSDDEIVRRAGLQSGVNIFHADLDAAERDLVKNAWVESAHITRRLPGTLVIDVVEREARAVALLGQDLYLVTPQGLPFKTVDEGDPSDLPVVTGLSPRDFAVDRARALERLGSVVELLDHYQSLPLSTVYPPQELHLNSDGALVLTVGNTPMTLALGLSDWRRKLAMAGRVLGKLQRGGQKPAILFLDNEAHSERVVVRMR